MDQQGVFVRDDRFDRSAVKAAIDRDGYAVIRDLIPIERIESIKTHWLKRFQETTPDGRVTWTVYYGQKSPVGFSSDAFQYLYRAIDILWNPPLHEETREVGLRMSALRNLAIDQAPEFGTRFTDALGVCPSVSYYPPEKGMMQKHVDGGTGKLMLVHILAPLTFRGTDYQGGGLRMWDRHGNVVDVDGVLKPGDAVIYDGSLEHEVLPIIPMPGKNIGRMQMFPLPLAFRTLEKDVRGLGAIPFVKYLYAKYAVTKNALLIALGKKGTLR
ncbi:MAG TPA: hypothetical protein VMU11_00325 [Verrucomicrobiae bacterium]|nr:hypothetical protein [Verrucomicrobiae bacterium]